MSDEIQKAEMRTAMLPSLPEAQLSAFLTPQLVQTDPPTRLSVSQQTQMIDEYKKGWLLNLFDGETRNTIKELVEEFPIDVFHDQIIVKRFDKQEVTLSSGIVLPETAKEIALEGVVVAAGPGWTDAQGYFHPNPISVGDHVVFNQYGAAIIEFGNGVEFLHMSSREIQFRFRKSSFLSKAKKATSQRKEIEDGIE